jgi:hypothetical protein
LPSPRVSAAPPSAASSPPAQAEPDQNAEPVVPILRYELPAPGDLLYIDIKKLARIHKPGHRLTGPQTSTTLQIRLWWAQQKKQAK